MLSWLASTARTVARLPPLAPLPALVSRPFLRPGPFESVLAVVAVRHNKTHSGAKKRFRQLGNGDFKRGQVGRSHLAQSKNGKRRMKLRQPAVVHPTNKKALRRLFAV